MKNFKYLLLTLVMPIAFAGCSDDPTYKDGEGENPNCYGVYFPTQSNASDLELDPTDPTVLTFEVKRLNSDGEITVPVEVTANKSDIFTVAPITFADGAEESSFSVSFPAAEVGTTYTCSIRVSDANYAKIYGTKSSEISFSVRRVKWLDVDAEKTITYEGKSYTGYEWYTDDILTTFYGVGNSVYPVKVQVRADSVDDDYPNGPKGLAGIYRMLDPYGEIYPFNDPGDYDNGVNVVINASDPNKVYIDRQYLGVHWSYGNMTVWSMAGYYLANPSKGSPAAYYGKIESGAISFPKGALMISMATYQGGGLYNSNNSGAFRLVVCQDQVVDYSLAVSNKEPKDGTVEIAANMGADLKTLKYAFFEGSLSATLAAAKSADMHNGIVATESITKSGTITAQMEKTGIYTIVINAYNSANTLVSTKYLSFGYIKSGDSQPVVATIGLNVTDKYIPAGYTSENSVEFYAFGENIQSGYYGVFESGKLTSSTDLAALVKSKGKALTADNLKAMNGDGFSIVVGNLVAGTQYTAVLLGFNGYVTEIKTATAKTNGVPHPLKRSYTADDLSDLDKASLFKTWNYYAGKVVSNAFSGSRSKIGSVTISENTTADTAEADYVDVSGLTGVAAQIGGDDKMRFELYKGVLYLVKDQIVGTYNNSPVSYVSTTTLLKSYSADNTLVGALVGDGYIAFVGNPGYITSNNLTFNGIRFLAFADNTLKTAVGGLTWYYDLMLADPEKDAANPMSVSGTAATTATVSLSNLAQHASVEPTNFVELRGRARMHALIDECMKNGAQPKNLATEGMPVEVSNLRAVNVKSSFKQTVSQSSVMDKSIITTKANAVIQ